MTKKAAKRLNTILEFNDQSVLRPAAAAKSSSSAPQKKGLGRGLEGLLGKDIDFTRTLAPSKKNDSHAKPAASADMVKKLSVKDLQRGKYQPRGAMDETGLKELADSISSQGIVQPLIVRQLPESKNKYEIIAGERRFQAAKLAGLNEVPALVVQVSDEQAAVFALIENMQREDLNPLEEARGIQRLIREFKFTHEQAAHAIGRSRSVTSNLLRLLNLTEPVQKMLLDNQLDMGHARALLGLNAADQIIAANRVVSQNLSVRQTENLVKQMADAVRKSPAVRKPVSKDADTLRLEKALSDYLSTRVEIKFNRQHQGALIIDFHSLDQLNELLARQGLDNIADES